MATTQDNSLGLVNESTYKTFVAPTRFYEFKDESLDYNGKNIKQGQGLRVGSRVARSARRVVTSQSWGGDFTVEAISKGMGLLWQACLGSGASTLVSGSTYQQVFTLGDTPSSLTIQKGTVRTDGTVDAQSYSGCMVTDWEFSFPNTEISELKVSVDAGDFSTAQAYATPSYPASPANLFHFANGAISTGTLTAPTSTALASSTTALANVRGGSIQVNNNLSLDRYNLGGSGKKSKPTMGLREITGSLDVEYDSVTFRDAVLADTPMSLVLTFTGGALSTGNETLQIVLPEIKLDGELPQANGTDLIVQSIKFTALDNLTAAQPIWVVARTADTAL